MRQVIPDIGRVVRREDGSFDYVAQVRIDHGPNPQDAELGVLVWGETGERFKPGDEWTPFTFAAEQP